MFEVETGQIKSLERDLFLMYSKAGPYANVDALNSLAFGAQRAGRENIKRDFINRNRWTVRSVQVDRARVNSIDKAFSVVGSTEDYMREQEFGGVKSKKGKFGVPIPTKEASGEGAGAGPRKRLPRPKNMLSAITLSKRGAATGTRQQRVQQAIHTAAAQGDSVVFLELERSRGLFRVTGTREHPKIRMLYNLSKVTVPTHQRKWLLPAVEATAKWGQVMYVAALEKQIARQKLFKSKRR